MADPIAHADLGLKEIQEALGDTVFKNLGIDELLEKLAHKDADAFEAKLMQVRVDYRDFYEADGRIKMDHLKEELAWNEKMNLLISLYITEHIVKAFFNGKMQGKMEKMSFDEAMAYFDGNEKGAEKSKNGKHLLWLEDNPFSRITMLFGLADLFAKKKKEGSEVFPLPGESRIVWQASTPAQEGGNMKPTFFSIVRELCKEKGMALTLLHPGEGAKGADGTWEIPKPKTDELQLVFAPAEGLPLGSDGSVNTDTLGWYRVLYDSDVHAQWVLTPLLLAGIYVLEGQTVDEALAAVNLGGADSKTKSVLSSISAVPVAPPNPVDQVAPVGQVAPVASAVPAVATTGVTSSPPPNP